MGFFNKGCKQGQQYLELSGNSIAAGQIEAIRADWARDHDRNDRWILDGRAPTPYSGIT